MRLTLQRTHTNGPATFGKLYADGVYLCFTLEDEIREVTGQSVASWKIKGATAIPSGQYRVTLEDSMRFGPGTLTINDVPGFSGIRMHAGNTPADTEGCPLLGMAITNTGIAGGTSRTAVALVKEAVLNAIRKGERVMIDIINPTVVT